MATTLRAIAASDDVAAEAAEIAVARGNAIDAVVSGVLAAAAAHESVLLGPLVVLIGGAGLGFRAVDGRHRQPGRGIPRPRGAVSARDIPDAAYVAVPLLPAALVATLASAGTMTFAQCIDVAIKVGKPSKPRAQLLKLFRGHGARAWLHASVRDELLHVAGRTAGGLLTLSDLERALPVIHEADLRRCGKGRAIDCPWPSDVDDASQARVVVASDARGLVCIAAYEIHSDGIELAPFGLRAPKCAAPVRRGSPRVTPGEVLPMAKTIRLFEAEGSVTLALGLVGSLRAAGALTAFASEYEGSPTQTTIESIRRLPGQAIGLVRYDERMTALTTV